MSKQNPDKTKPTASPVEGTAEEGAPKVKSPYHAPTLIQLGPLTEVTIGVQGDRSEPGGGSAFPAVPAGGGS